MNYFSLGALNIKIIKSSPTPAARNRYIGILRPLQYAIVYSSTPIKNNTSTILTPVKSVLL